MMWAGPPMEANRAPLEILAEEKENWLPIVQIHAKKVSADFTKLEWE